MTLGVPPIGPPAPYDPYNPPPRPTDPHLSPLPPPQDPYADYPLNFQEIYQAPLQGGFSRFAIASFVFSLCGGVVLSVIFGIVALARIKRRGQTGRGLAIAGLAISGVWLAFAAVAAILGLAGVTSLADRDRSGSINNQGAVFLSDLRVGDCVSGLQDDHAVSYVTGVPCASAHQAEVFARFDLPASEWPGESTVDKWSRDACADRLKKYAPKKAKSVDVIYFSPIEASWSRDRAVICLAFDQKGSLVGGLRG